MPFTSISAGWIFTLMGLLDDGRPLNQGKSHNYQKAGERIDKLRCEAITEIWDERGFEGVKGLLAPSGATDLIGRYTASCVTDVCSQSDFIQRCLSLDGELQSKAEWCLRGFLSAIGDDVCAEVINMVAKKLSVEESKRLFVCAPFNASTWRLLDDSSEDIRTGYWKDVVPYWKEQTPAELNELIDYLLEAHRPRAAFHVVCMNFKDIETSRFKRLLHDIATVNTEPAGQVRLDPRCQPWRAKRRLVDPSSREAALLTRRAHSARGEAK